MITQTSLVHVQIFTTEKVVLGHNILFKKKKKQWADKTKFLITVDGWENFDAFLFWKDILLANSQFLYKRLGRGNL